MTDTDATQRLEAATHRLTASMRRTIKRALVIPQGPSPLPPPDNPLYELHLGQHRFIARLRGRPCGCGTCDA